VSRARRALGGRLAQRQFHGLGVAHASVGAGASDDLPGAFGRADAGQLETLVDERRDGDAASRCRLFDGAPAFFTQRDGKSADDPAERRTPGRRDAADRGS
jgi:hypothetical protein